MERKITENTIITEALEIAHLNLPVQVLGNLFADEIADAVKTSGAKLVGLSALMTTTVPAMEETIKLIRKEAPFCKVIVGGAVLTQEYADSIGADKYAKDAMEAVRYAETI